MIEILIDSHHGVYIPQLFATHTAHAWDNINQDDLAAIAAGPDHTGYWDAWDIITTNATHTDEDGNIWHLYQDGDLFAVCYDTMTAQERKDFFPC